MNDEAVDCYRTGAEQLWDELRRLDLLIRRRIVGMQGERGPEQPSPFGGLVISDEEIDRLMNRDAGSDRISGAASDEIALLDREIGECEGRIKKKRYLAEREGIELPLSRLARLFDLSPLEETCLAACLAPEIDPRYERLYGYLHDDLTKKLPTPFLVMDLLGCSFEERLAARKLFDPSGALFSQRLVSFASAGPDVQDPLLSRQLRLDERTAAFIAGCDTMDPLIGERGGPDDSKGDPELVTLPDAEYRRLRAFVGSRRAGRTGVGRNHVLHFHGPSGAGKRSVARMLCRDLGIPLLVADMSRMPHNEPLFSESLLRLFREARLRCAALCLEHVDTLFDDPAPDFRQTVLRNFLSDAPFMTVLIGASRWKGERVAGGERFISIEFPVPDIIARKGLLEREAQRRLFCGEGIDFGALAGRFRFTPGQIRDAVAAAGNLARWRDPDNPTVERDDLFAACRDQSNQGLVALARKIEPVYGWDDIVLPPDQTVQLREICNQSRYRHLVYGEWGFDRKISYGKGLNLLFSGAPGTGKTMAAEVIANELGLDLYRIDLSRVVSKYIGETEKNLDRIFTEARTSNAILFFDEADALFGKRSEVKDAHDRYANIEIGYLLQKMEEYEGVAVLATNFRSNLDDAFVRRLQYVVEFPLPSLEERRRIWAKVWPDGAPLQPGLDLDFPARRFEVPGGNIRNIALAAAFLAADDDGVIGISHLLRAARREFQKMGKIVSEADFGIA